MSMKFWNFNLVTQDQTVITGSNENAFFPASNLKDERTTKVFRSTTTSSEIVFDFITTEEVDSILLCPSFKTGWGFNNTITVEANATNTWGAPAFTTTILPADIDEQFEMAVKEFTAQSYRFWRLSFTGVAYVEVSKVFIGKLNNIGGRSVSFGWSYLNTDLSVSTFNRYGQKFTDIVTSQKRMAFNIENLTKDQVDEFFEVYDYNRTFRPFFFMVCDCDIINNVRRFSGLFYMEQIPEVINEHHALYSVSCVVAEAK